ncbi:reverse transcriptase [Tanacetum coccineum]
MAPSTRLVTVNSSNGDEGIIREYLDSQLAEMRNLIATLGLQQNQAMNQRKTSQSIWEFLGANGDNVGWDVYKNAIIQRFGSIFEVSALKNAKYDKSARDYQYLFDTLLCRVTISPEHAISLYLGGLPTDLEMCVRMFKPATLVEAYSLTTLREAILEPVKKKSKPIGNANVSRFGNGGYYRNNNMPAVLPLPASSSGLRPKPNTLVNAPVRKQLTQKEYQEKRAQNLYFYYDQRYSPCHKCSRQLYSLVVLADKDEEYFEVEEGDDELIIPYEIPQISLNALNGANTFQTMRVTGKVGKHELHVLTDCGSIHNFLDINVARKVGCLQEETFNTDMMILPLEACEMVLGIQWLATLSDIKCNFSQLRMEFMYKNKRMTLRGTPKAAMHLMDRKHRSKDFEIGSSAELLMFCVYPNTGIQLMNAEGNKGDEVLTPELDKVVQTFVDVFALLTKLALQRSHNYRIPLIPNAQPVNIRPYTHPPMQKEALMNEVFQPYLRKFTLVFFDDILVYNSTMDEHVQHLTTILETMRHNKLFAKKSKCVSGTSHVEYLGHVIST